MNSNIIIKIILVLFYFIIEINLFAIWNRRCLNEMANIKAILAFIAHLIITVIVACSIILG
jgi:hypothetical protein